MRKSARTVIGVLSALAIVALAASTTYFANSAVKGWADEQWSKLTNTSASGHEGSAPAVALTYSGLRFYAAPQGAANPATSTVTLTATLSPDDATDKTVVWSVSDAASVGVSASETQSGESVTLTALKVFSGTVTVTASSKVDSSISSSCSVSFYNSVSDIKLSSISMGGESYDLSAGSRSYSSVKGNGTYFRYTDNSSLADAANIRSSEDAVSNWVGTFVCSDQKASFTVLVKGVNPAFPANAASSSCRKTGWVNGVGPSGGMPVLGPTNNHADCTVGAMDASGYVPLTFSLTTGKNENSWVCYAALDGRYVGFRIDYYTPVASIAGVTPSTTI